MSKLFQKFGKKATRETAAANNIDYEQVIVSFVKNEISYDQIDKIRGMDIVICTTANTDEEAKELLTLMGAPFAK